jgi:hypothetical protein
VEVTLMSKSKPFLEELEALVKKHNVTDAYAGGTRVDADGKWWAVVWDSPGGGQPARNDGEKGPFDTKEEAEKARDEWAARKASVRNNFK